MRARLFENGVIHASFRAFRRDLSNYNFLAIAAAIIVAVAAVTSVDLFTDRVRLALDRQSSALLAADLAIIGTSVLPEQYRTTAAALNVTTTDIISMRSVVAAGDQLQLTELKAVESAYPLRGKLMVADRPHDVPRATTEIPTPGTAWVEARLLGILGLSMGDTIEVGAAELAIEQVLVLEPDRGGDLFSIAPRVMINADDLPATGLIVPGSRVRYTLLGAGTLDAMAKFKSSLQLRAGDRIVSPKNARPEIQTALNRADKFLSLAALTTIVLAGVAIALGARSFCIEHQDTVALLRTLGASRRYIFQYFSLEILLLGASCAVIGAAVGFVGQESIARAMHGFTQGPLPAPPIGSAIRAGLIALLALGGFALPQLMVLRDVPPLRVLRKDLDMATPSTARLVLYAAIGVIIIAPWRGGEWQLTGWAVVGLALGLALLAAVAYIMNRLVGRMGRNTPLQWRFGLANLYRRGGLTVLQTTAIGLGITALLVLAIIRGDLLETWAKSLPQKAPNQFLINIQREDVAGLETFFRVRKLSTPGFYPMIRGRLVGINDETITPESFEDPRAQRLVEREFNLSTATHPKPYNQILSGDWWNPDDSQNWFSIEQGIAKRLGIKIGDTLTYQVAGESVSATVKNIREVQWDSMQVNFFVESPPALLDDFPATFITSFFLQPSETPLLRDLVAEFPSVTVIDVAALVQNVRAIMDRSAATIEFVFYFTVTAGLLVLIAAIQSTQGERIFESSLLKTFGASRLKTSSMMAIEFIAIGLLAGVIAGLIAIVVGWLLAVNVLDIEFVPSSATLWSGAAIGVAAVCGIGTAAVYHALRQPAVNVLRYRG